MALTARINVARFTVSLSIFTLYREFFSLYILNCAKYKPDSSYPLSIRLVLMISVSGLIDFQRKKPTNISSIIIQPFCLRWFHIVLNIIFIMRVYLFVFNEYMMLWRNDNKAGMTAEMMFRIRQTIIAMPIIVGLNSILNVICVSMIFVPLKMFSIQLLADTTTRYESISPTTAPMAVRTKFSQTICESSVFLCAPKAFRIPISHNLFSMRLEINPHRFNAGTKSMANIIIRKSVTIFFMSGPSLDQRLNVLTQ